MIRRTELNAMLANSLIERLGWRIGQSCFLFETERTNFQATDSFTSLDIDQVIDRTSITSSEHAAAYITGCRNNAMPDLQNMDFKLGDYPLVSNLANLYERI